MNVLALQEPYISNGRVYGLLKMRVYMKNGGGKAIVANNTMSVASYMEEHGMCVWMKMGNREIYVCFVYCSFSMPMKSIIEYIRKVVNIVRGKPLLMYLGV